MNTKSGHSFLIFLSTILFQGAFAGAPLKGVDVKLGRPGHNGSGRFSSPEISLDAGSWCYAVFERGSPKAPDVIIELTPALNGQCDESTLQTAHLTKEMALLVVDSDQSRVPGNLLEVAPVSTMQLLSYADGSTNQWPLKMMKNGVVKFFNEAKSRNSQSVDEGDLLLALPQELQDLINEKSRNALHLMIILREIQEGKKGLNAVNVKLA